MLRLLGGDGDVVDVGIRRSDPAPGDHVLDGVRRTLWELDRLASAIRAMRDGGSLRPAEETVRILTRAAQVETRRRMIDRALSQRTAREVEILRCMAAGQTGPEVAARLHISEKTERAHVANILRKLRVRSKLQAVVFAAAAGFVELTIPTQQRETTVRRLPEPERAAQA